MNPSQANTLGDYMHESAKQDFAIQRFQVKYLCLLIGVLLPFGWGLPQGADLWAATMAPAAGMIGFALGAIIDQLRHPH